MAVQLTSLDVDRRKKVMKGCNAGQSRWWKSSLEQQAVLQTHDTSVIGINHMSKVERGEAPCQETEEDPHRDTKELKFLTSKISY